MQREAAKKLIRDTFEQPFNKDQFAVFAKNLLNHIESAPFPRPRTGQMIFEDFRSHIASFDRIGKYTDSEGNKLDVLVVNLSKTSSVDRARATQRKFVAKYLKESQGAQLKDAALVAFVSPNEEDWRFSFVKMDYKIETTEKGRVKVKEEFTPARRYSFLVGQNENSHTAQSQLLPILENTDKNPTLVDLENAFRIEKVTKEFFEQYRELYHNTKVALDELVAKDKDIRADFETKGVDTVDFAKKLLGQIVFLYFLQKKGWFGVKRKAAWGTGSKAFLRELFLGNHGKYKNFFNDILEPLFYSTLAVERPENYADRFDCKIPFLNGGLFDPLNNYDWVNTEILLPNDLFSNNDRTKQGDTGTGILDVFDRYNFTVKEDEPLEKEVAVDPEMLGKVFENLLEVKDRKSKGTYYTPREIVHYMCQVSLINYLATELENTVPREDIETLIKHGETFIDHDVVHLEKVSSNPNYRGRYEELRLGESVKQHAGLIDRKLADIKVCDPAVGSGAFLVGMMSEVVRTRMVLTQFMGNGDRTPYDLKRHAIQDSLYGVDIDLGAVEIAKLRLWLSLIVDEDDYRQIKPLPNLDYKIMQGNSLLEEYEGIKLIDERFFEKQEEKAIVRQRLERDQSKLQREYIQLNSERKLTKTKKAELEKKLKEIEKTLKELDKPRSNGQDELGLYGKSEVRSKADRLLKLHEQFFSAYNKREKDRLKKEVDSLTWDLVETTLKQQGKADKLEDVRRFQQTNTRPFFLWKLNFADVFGEQDGFDVVIANPPYLLLQNSDMSPSIQTSLKNTFVVAQYKVDLYQLFIELGLRLLTRAGVLSYITPNTFLRNKHSNKLRELILERTSVLRLILFYVKVFDDPSVDNVVLILQDSRGRDNVQNRIGIQSITDLRTESIGIQLHFVDQSAIKGPAYAFNFEHSTEQSDLISSLEKHTVSFGTIGRAYFGVQTMNRTEFVSTIKVSDDYVPVIDGTNVRRYCLKPPTEYICFRSEAIKSGGNPKVYEQERIVVRQIGKYPEGTLCPPGMVTLNTIYNLYLSDSDYFIEYVLAIINSKLMQYLWNIQHYDHKATFPKIKKAPLESLPIRVISKHEQQPLVRLVKDVISRKTENPNAKTERFERQIDLLVYKLYGLTEEEVRMVEESAGRKD